jgi:DNA-binding beta-propeller fold protein YncE
VKRLLGSWYLGDAVLSQGGKQLYFVNRSRGTVAVFDTVSEKTVAEVALDFGPEWSWEIADDRIELSPDERWLVVTQENKGTVWVLDRHNLKVIDRMEIGEQISALRTRSNGAGWEIHLLLRDRYRDRSRWLILEGPRGLDGSAPVLSSTDPLQGAGNVAVNRTLTLQFNEPMDRHTLNEDNIAVSCNTCEESEVAIDVAIEKNNRVTHLICEGTWPIQANLSVSLGTGVRDLTGQPLANPLSFSFNTAGNAAPPYVALISDFSQVGSDASHVAVDPLGRWILTNDYYGDDLYIHDQRTHEFVTRLDTADGPADILCPPGTNKAYIANHLQGTLSVLDLGALVYVGTIPVDTNPNHMALSRDGKVLNVVCSASDTVVQVDVATDQVLGRLPAPEGTDLATVETGKKADWVAAGWNSLELFDTGGARTYQVPNGGGARIVQMLASSDGYQLFLLEQWRSQQYVMDTVTWTRTDTLPSPTIASKLLESPDKRFLLAAYREEGLIRIRDRLTTETVGLIEGVGDVYDMAFSSDGKKLFVLRRGNPGRILIFSWSDGTDVASPTVAGVDPWDGATVVPANTVVRVRFSEPVDRRTVNEENLWIAGGTISPVHAEVSLSRDNLTALIVPEIPFEVGTSFTVNVSQQVRDLSGNPLVPAYNSDFQTAFQANPAPALLFSGTSDVIGSPYYIAPLVDGDPVLVANYHSNALTLHHPVTLQQGFSINREKRTGRVLPYDGNRAWVNYPENREISLINVTNGLAEDTVVYSRERRAEAMSADRSRLALAIGGDPAYLYVLDLGNDGATSTREFEIWDWPRSLALSPDGRYAYVAYWSDILVINLETQILERRLFGSDMQSIVIDPSGRLLYVAENNRDRVRVMDIETGATLTTLPVGQGEWSVVPSRQGDIVAILCRGEGTIRFYDGYTNGLLQVYQHVQGETLRAAEFSPDGNRFYFTWDSSARDGVTALSLVNRRTSPPPSPTPTVTPAVTPTPTPNPSQQPGNPFDVVVDGLVDEHDLLMLMEMGTMQGGEPAEPGLFMFSLYWHQ